MRDLIFFISEAFVSIRRSPLMMVITVGTISISMIIFGLFILMSLNFNNLLHYYSSKLEIRVYMKQDLTKEELKNFEKTIGVMTSVKKVEFVDKKAAMSLMKTFYNNLDLDLLESNPFPNAFHIYLHDSQNLGAMVRHFKKYKQVEDVGYQGEIAKKIHQISTVAQYAGLIMVALFGLTTLFIIMNTIRLTIIARQDEVSIMTLVGATHRFIQGPFLVEGALMGIFGSAISVLFLKYSYTFFSVKIQSLLPFAPLVLDKVQLNAVYGILILIGTGLGLIGAYISIRKALKITLIK